MRLQKQAGRTYTNKAGKTVAYDKWVIVLDPGLVKALGWKEGLELSGAARTGRLIIEAAIST
jgi:hypothetical protein